MVFGKPPFDKDKALRESLLEAGGRAAVLLVQLFALLMLSSFPVPFWHMAGVRPAFLLMAVYYWAVFRPALLPPVWAFGAGLALDLVCATPLGLNALTLTAAQWFTRAQRRFLIGQSFVVLWMCFFLLALAACVFQWAAFSLLTLSLVPVRSAAVSAALTGLFFPLVAGVFHAFGKSERRRGV